VEGYRLLRDQRGVHLFSAHIALQHHERLDGSGYPRGMRGKDIHLWSQIVSVADTFDTMTGVQAGHGGLPPHEAMAQLALQAEAGRLEARYVRHLILRLAAFPEGSILLLETGEVAVVIAQTGLGGQHPVVRVMSDARLHLVDPVERSLDGSAPETSVRSVLTDYPALLYEQMRAARRA
jgi:HD-GYP domain-containing protein (c-di-GMP phosphodiesterase class II)